MIFRYKPAIPEQTFAAASTDSSTALKDAALNAGAAAVVLLQASAQSSSIGRTVEGEEFADAAVSQAVAALNVPVTVGSQASLQATQTATASAEAVTVQGGTAEAVARFDDGSGLPSGPSAGSFGGILDTTANPADLSIGAGALLDVQVRDSLNARATNTAGGAEASALAPAIDGLYAVSADIGASGTVQVQLAAALGATASTVGTAPGSGDADASATVQRLAAITADDPNALVPDPSTLSFGGAGSLTANAGSTAAPITLLATASSVATDASATTTAALVAGLTDQVGFASSIEAGSPLAITANAVVSQVAQAAGTEGAAIAASGSTSDAVFGAQVGTISSSADARLTASATLSSTATSSAGTVTSSAALPLAAGGWINSLASAVIRRAFNARPLSISQLRPATWVAPPLRQLRQPVRTTMGSQARCLAD